MVKELFYISPSTQMLSLQAGVFGSKCQGGMARSGREQGGGSEPGRLGRQFKCYCSVTVWDISSRDYKEREKEMKEPFTSGI